MAAYEVIKEYLNPCGGERYAQKEFFEVETDDPLEYVRGIAQFPLMESGVSEDGDPVIVTGDGKGYFVRYTFCK